MIKEIKVRQANTGMFYATCYSTKTGKITQWGLTPNVANKRLYDDILKAYNGEIVIDPSTYKSVMQSLINT